MRKQVILYAALLSLLGSCMVGPKYSQPEVATHDQYQGDTTISSVVADSLAGETRWFRLFNDSVLVQLIQTGLDSNLDVLAATKRIDEARAQFGFAKADLYPAFGYGGRYFYFDPSSNGVNPIANPYRNYQMTGTISWEIDFWGKIRHAKNQALHQLVSTEESLRSAKLSLVSEIAVTYFALLDLDNKIKITSGTITSRQKGFDIIAARFERGYAAEIDKLQAEQQLEDAKATLYQFERLSLVTERALCVLLGLPPSKLARGLSITEQAVAPYVPEGLPAELLTKRPDLRAFENQVKAQYDRIGVATAMRYPSFELTGFLGLASSDLTNLVSGGSGTFNLVANLTGPLFNFGKNKRRIEVEKHRMEQLAYGYEKNYLVALAEVENNLTGIRTLKEEVVHRKAQADAARRVLELSNARYNNGYVAYLEVLDSERNLFNAEMLYSTAVRDYINTYVNLYKAFGGGW